MWARLSSCWCCALLANCVASLMNCISGVLELLTQANGSTFPPKATRYGGASTSLVRLLTWSFQRSSMGLVYGGFQKGFLAVGSKGSPRSFEAGEKEA